MFQLAPSSVTAHRGQGTIEVDRRVAGVRNVWSRLEPWDGSDAAAASESRCKVAEGGMAGRPSSALRSVLAPLALAQFICTFAGSNMNVMINDVSTDLGTTVHACR
jgi:hypothetical protein